MKNDKVKKILSENSNGSVIFTNDSIGLRSYNRNTLYWPVEYLRGQNFYLAIGLARNGQPFGSSPDKVYALDSAYLVVEHVDYPTFLSQTNYRGQYADTTTSTPIIYGRQINIKLPIGRKRMLWVYKAVD